MEVQDEAAGPEKQPWSATAQDKGNDGEIREERHNTSARGKLTVADFVIRLYAGTRIGQYGSFFTTLNNT